MAITRDVFWQTLHKIHIYKDSREAVFKATMITISWIGGIHFACATEKDAQSIGVAFYLFSLALIMEYLIPLLKGKTIWNRILPFVLCGINFVLVFFAFALLLNSPFEGIEDRYLRDLTIASLIFIWSDVIVMLLIKPDSKKSDLKKSLENNLKNIELNSK